VHGAAQALGSEQVPAMQLPNEQALRQKPQWLGSVNVSTSHPLRGSRSQSARPPTQLVTAHTPATQPTVPFTAVGQAFPQAPQLRESVSLLVSQPFVGSPSQFSQPGLHVPIRHVPLTQSPIAFGGMQGLSQSPQWRSSLYTSTHEPPHDVDVSQSGVQNARPAVLTRQSVPMQIIPQLPQCAGSSSGSHVPSSSQSA
jgi:hypothetical protein